MKKMALKKLTHSDLTFFKCYFASQAEKPSKQKALNLSSDVFVDQLYPNLREDWADKKFYISLNMYGPGLKDAYVLARKILKSEGSKNWRLNGELIYSPEDDLERYDSLRPGDYALMGFEGEMAPEAVFIDLISQTNSEDCALYEVFSQMLSSGMIVIESVQLQTIVAHIQLPPHHPVYRFLLDEDLIATVEGDPEAKLRVYRHSGTVMSSEELETSRKKADRIGRLGEDLISHYFQQQLKEEKILDFEWISRNNAVAPYDFKVRKLDGTVTLLDVKSTTSGHETKFHISRAEIITMAEAPEEYRLFRIYDLTEYGGKLRISSEMRDFANGLIEKFALLPDGINVDSVSCAPELISFSEAIEIIVESEE